MRHGQSISMCVFNRYLNTFLILLFGLFGVLTAQSASYPPASASFVSDPRLERHNQAVRELKNLHFFHKGYGMHISPNLIELSKIAEETTRITRIDNPLLKHRYGLTQVDGKVIGLYNVGYEGISVGVLGCVACHSGKAAGQWIVGIGNKNIDVSVIGKDADRVQNVWKTLTPGHRKTEAYRTVEESAIAFAKELRDRKRENLTQGLVPTSVIRKWFCRMAGRDYPDEMPRGAVKVPHLFGYSEKRAVGQFSDGGGDGLLPGWGIAVELAAGQKPEHVREYLPKIEHAEEILGDLLPPRYPFPIDSVRAERGRGLFQAKCSGCHGQYSRDPEGHPIYLPPKVIPWARVRTDHERLERLDEDFLALIRQSPLSDIIRQTAHQDSYIAPRLHAVWARFPYLHNASVPTVRDLLERSEHRPKLFSLRNAGELERFDPERLGLQTRGRFEIRRPIKWGKRASYDTSLTGQSNQGHEFGTELSGTEKDEIVEYLKTL